jgi:hypothetical protein
MWRRTGVGTLVVLGTILAMLSILAIWISRQVMETDQWTETSSELLEDPAIQSAVSGYLVDQLFTRVDVEAELRSALPPRAEGLAGPAAGALRRGAEDVALRAMKRPEVQQAWEDANRQAHEVFVKIVEGGGDIVSTEGGVVTLDLKAMLTEISQRTGIGGRIAARLPADAATIEVLRSDQLDTAQTVAKNLKPLALVLVLLMLACYGGAIALARGRRRTTLRACGIGLVFAGVAALAIRSIGGQSIVDSLASTAAVRPAIEDTWSIGTSLLVGVATATIAYGVLVIIGAWLAGPTRAATSVRRAIAPYARDWRIAYAFLVAVILLVLLWAPTEGTRRVLPALALIILLVAGYEVLRRQTKAEFPDAVRGRISFSKARDALRRSPPAATTELAASAPAEIAEDTSVAELERLTELHRAGGLDDAEFAAAKQRVLTRT